MIKITLPVSYFFFLLLLTLQGCSNNYSVKSKEFDILLTLTLPLSCTFSRIIFRHFVIPQVILMMHDT